MPSSPPLEADAATLRDGSLVVIRPLGATDRRALTTAFKRMGEESRYRRFLCATPTLTETQLRYLTEIDQRDHVALAAVDATYGSEILGVARSVRLAGPEAELAIAVIDEYQGRGLGSVLIAALVDRAGAQGVKTYRADVLADNVPMLRLLGGMGEMRVSHGGPALRVRVDLLSA